VTVCDLTIDVITKAVYFIDKQKATRISLIMLEDGVRSYVPLHSKEEQGKACDERQ